MENYDIADYTVIDLETTGRNINECEIMECKQKEKKVMPTLSMFYGILIRMYFDDHNPPHIHAIYNDVEACYDFDGNAIDGNLPNKQHKLVVAWIELHKDELNANWKLAQEGEPVFKIEPLR